MRRAFAAGLAAVAGSVFFLNLDLFFYEKGLWPVPPLHFVLVLAAGAFCFAAGARRLPHSPAWRLLLAMAVLGLAGFLWSAGDASAWQAAQDPVLALIYLSAWLMILAEPAARRVMPGVLLAGLLVASGLNFLEIARPRLISDIFGRSAGTYLNPNFSAQGILLGLVLLLPRFRGLPAAALLAVAGAAVLSTFSRGGIFMAAVVAAAWLAPRIRRRPVPALMGGGALAASALVFFSVVPQDLLQAADVAQRMESLAGAGIQDAAGNDRLALAEEGMTLFLQRPLRGHGTGRSRGLLVGTTPLGPHNQFLETAVDHGLVGLGVLIAWFLVFFRRRAGLLPLFLLGDCFFFHGIFLNRQVLLALAVAESRGGEDENTERGRAVR